MSNSWKPSLFNTVEEAEQFFALNPTESTLGNSQSLLELIETVPTIMNAFLGNREPVAISFYYSSDIEGEIIDGSEVFLIVSKFSIKTIDGLWNYHKPFTSSLAETIVCLNFEKLLK